MRNGHLSKYASAANHGRGFTYLHAITGKNTRATWQNEESPNKVHRQWVDYGKRAVRHSGLHQPRNKAMWLDTSESTSGSTTYLRDEQGGTRNERACAKGQSPRQSAGSPQKEKPSSCEEVARQGLVISGLGTKNRLTS